MLARKPKPVKSRQLKFNHEWWDSTEIELKWWWILTRDWHQVELRLKHDSPCPTICYTLHSVHILRWNRKWSQNQIKHKTTNSVPAKTQNSKLSFLTTSDHRNELDKLPRHLKNYGLCNLSDAPIAHQLPERKLEVLAQGILERTSSSNNREEHQSHRKEQRHARPTLYHREFAGIWNPRFYSSLRQPDRDDRWKEAFTWHRSRAPQPLLRHLTIFGHLLGIGWPPTSLHFTQESFIFFALIFVIYYNHGSKFAA